jgi:predicted enzyme related to lactoylglutathione lyase
MDFYSALFGWTWEVGGPEMGFYSIAHSDGSAVLGIGQGEGGLGEATIYFKTSDIEASLKKVTDNGGQIGMGPMTVPETGIMAIVHDSSGARHGLWQPINFSGFGTMWEPGAPGWFDHTSSDLRKAASYYSAVTGHPTQDIGAGGLVLTAGENQMFASLSEAHPGAEPAWSPIYVVSSLDGARKTATAQGATIVVEEMDVPGSAISVFVEPVCHQTITVMRPGEF